MATSGAIRAGRAYVELFAEDSKLMRGLKAAQKNLKSWGRSVTMAGVKVAGVGAAIMTPLLASAKVFSDVGDNLAKMSLRTGVSVEALSLLSYAADLSGTSVGDLENGIRRMQRTVVDAVAGLSTAQLALGMIGLSAKQLAGLAPEKQFEAIADRIDAIPDATRKAAAAMMIFGRSGTGLLPLMQGGSAGINDLMGRGRRLGLEVSTEDAKAAEMFQDTWTDLQKTTKQVAFTVGSVLAPTLQNAMESVLPYVVGAIRWAKANPEIVIGTLKVAAGLVVLGAALVVAGGALTALGVATGAAMSLLGAMGAVLGFIISPLGVVVTLAAGLGGVLLYSSGVGAHALSWLGERFKDLRSDAQLAFKGISDAMVAGDWALAAKILWLTLKLEWQKGVTALLTYWATFNAGFLVMANDAFWGVAKIANSAFAEISKVWERVWIGMAAYVGEALAGIGDLVGSTTMKGVGTVLDQIARKRAVELSLEDARIESQRQGMENLFTGLQQAGRGNIMRGWGEEIGQAAMELAAARAEWQAAIRKAAEERAAVEGPGEPRKWKSPNLGALDLAVRTAKGEAMGTFQGAAAERMGYGSTAADRTAEATERTAKATEDMARKIDDMQAAFE